MESAKKFLGGISGREWTFFFAILAIMTLIGIFFDDGGRGRVFARIEMIARWLKGGEKPEVVTWPAWGYAWVIAFIGTYKHVVLIQAFLGAVSLSWLVRRIWTEFPNSHRICYLLLLLAVPWHILQVRLYPHALAGSLALLSILSLERSLVSKKWRFAWLSGLLAGAAQNFRTEFLLVPGVILVCLYILKKRRILQNLSLKPAAIYALVALLCQVPWAAFYYQQNGRISLTESNFGHVLFVALGSSPNNPWGITGDDQQAQEVINNAGYSFSSLSDAGSQFLLKFVLVKLKEHPFGLISRTFQQLQNCVFAPFAWGEPRLHKESALYIDVLREELKAKIGLGSDVRQLTSYRRQGLFEQAIHDKPALLSLAYQGISIAFGFIILILAIYGLIILVFCRNLRPLTPLLYLLGCVAFYKIGMNICMAYQIFYLNNIYPMLIPFVGIATFSWKSHLRKKLDKKVSII